VSQWLRRYTSITLLVGPFVDVADGWSPEPGILNATTDSMWLWQHGFPVVAVLNLKGTGRVLTHRSDGMYTLALVGNIDLIHEGPATLLISEDATMRPYVQRVMIVNEYRWDALIDSHAATYGLLEVEPIKYRGGKLDAAAIDTAAFTAIKFGNDFLTSDKIHDDAISAEHFATGAVTDDALAASAINKIRDSILADSTPFDGADIDAAISTRSSHSVADVWDALLSGLTAVGSIGEKLADWVLGSDDKVEVSSDAHTSGQTVAAVTGAVGSVTGAVGSVTGAVGSVTGGVGGDLAGDVQGNVDGTVASVVGDVGGDVTGDVKGNVDGSVASVTARVTADADQIAGNADAALALSASARGIILCECDGGGHASDTINCSTLVETTADHYNGRIVIFYNAGDVLYGEATDIVSYVAGTLTVTGMTGPPNDGDLFVIV